MALKTQSKKQLRNQAKKAKKQVAAREDTVRNLLENQDLHDDLKQLAEAARKAYSRVASNGPQALLQDKKVHSELRAASGAAADAKQHLAKPKKKRGGFFRMLLLGTIGAAVAVVAVPSLRSKALDAVFGPEEQLDYSSAAPSGAASVNGSAAAAAAAETSASETSAN